jgi:SAM-dependent methyltransferase
VSHSHGEHAALERLLVNIQPDVREILARCLSGILPPSVALMQLLSLIEDASAVRTIIDEVTGRAASLSRSTDSLLRDRVDELTQLVVDNEAGCEKIAEMLRTNMDTPDQMQTVEEGIAFCERLFDWSVQQSEEASVALYSLGSSGILERATREIVSLLERWEVITPETTLLDLGCGIGRVVVEVAPKVLEVHGTDISANMIAAARRRSSHLKNAHLVKGSGRNLRQYDDAMFDTVIAVDVFPYLNQSGSQLVSDHFAEIHRVLKGGGSLVILNYSYRGSDDADVTDVRRNAAESGFDIVKGGVRPFTTWDGSAFHLVSRLTG